MSSSFKKISRFSGILSDVHVHRKIDINFEFLNHSKGIDDVIFHSYFIVYISSDEKNEKSKDWNHYSRKFYLPKPKDYAETYGRIYEFTSLLEDARVVKWMLLMCKLINFYEKIFNEQMYRNSRNPNNFVYNYQQAEEFEKKGHMQKELSFWVHWSEIPYNLHEVELRRQLWSFYLDNPPDSSLHWHHCDVERLIKRITDKKSFSWGVAGLRALCCKELYDFAGRRIQYPVPDLRVDFKVAREITEVIDIFMSDIELSPILMESKDGSKIHYASII